MTGRWIQLKLAFPQGVELDYAKYDYLRLEVDEMAKKGPKPCFGGHWDGAAWVCTLYESQQGGLSPIERWVEPAGEAFEVSGELVRRLERIRARRKAQEK